MESRSSLLILLVLILWVELSEASHRSTVEAIETSKGIVVGPEDFVVVVFLLVALDANKLL